MGAMMAGGGGRQRGAEEVVIIIMTVPPCQRRGISKSWESYVPSGAQNLPRTPDRQTVSQSAESVCHTASTSDDEEENAAK